MKERQATPLTPNRHQESVRAVSNLLKGIIELGITWRVERGPGISAGYYSQQAPAPGLRHCCGSSAAQDQSGYPAEGILVQPRAPSKVPVSSAKNRVVVFAPPLVAIHKYPVIR